MANLQTLGRNQVDTIRGMALRHITHRRVIDSRVRRSLLGRNLIEESHTGWFRLTKKGQLVALGIVSQRKPRGEVEH